MHVTDLAWLRALPKLGTSKDINRAITLMDTSTSTSEKAASQ